MKARKSVIVALMALLAIFLGRCSADDPGVCTTCPPASIGTPYDFVVPEGFPQPIIPADNPMTLEGIELGRHLFYDTRLSVDLTVSCASCHLQVFGFADQPDRPLSTGVNGTTRRSSMPLFNLAWQNEFFWDGRVSSLEEQSLHPIVDPIEMANDLGTVVARLEADTAYPNMFKLAFGDAKINQDRLAKALAQFERSIISAGSEYDSIKRLGGATNLFVEEPGVISGSKNEGYRMFINEEGDCFHCHTPANHMFGAYGDLSDVINYKNNGLRTQAELDASGADRGREEVTNSIDDRGKFKVPSIRNILVTGPFMHDGSMDLNQVIEHYNMGGHPSNSIDSSSMNFVGIGHNWTKEQKDDLIAFLSTLTDYGFLDDPKLSDPFD